MTTEAMTNLSVEDVVDAYVRRLESKKTEVARIASFWNAFEGWLKFELALALYEKGRRPWTDQSPDATWGTIGLEYKLPLKRSTTRGAVQAQKQVDLWVCSSGAERWHYVELKVAFCNSNLRKQVGSAKDDLVCLRAARDAKCDGRIVLLVAVGFTDKEIDALKEDGEASVPWRLKEDNEHGVGPDSTPSVALVNFTENVSG